MPLTNNQDKSNIRLTLIYDNNPMVKGLEFDWGFSCLIETKENKILFDTGNDGKILLENMKKLGINPMSIDTLFLSHYHHDHTGGLKHFLKTNPDVSVYYPQSFPYELSELIIKSSSKAIAVSTSQEFLPGIFSLGEMDSNIPEQSLALRSPEGIVVITGCAHPGIINILQKVKNKFPNELIYLVLGGFHLHRLDDDEINDVVQNIFNLDVLTVAPAHCTGDSARIMFKEVFNADYIDAGVGKQIIINCIR